MNIDKFHKDIDSEYRKFKRGDYGTLEVKFYGKKRGNKVIPEWSFTFHSKITPKKDIV